MDLAKGSRQVTLRKQVESFAINIVGLHLVFEVMPQFFAFTPTLDASFLKVFESFIQIVEGNLVTENAGCALSFTISFASLGRQRDGRDISGAKIFFGFVVMLLRSGPARFNGDDFFIEGDCSLIATFVEGFFSLVHQLLSLRVMR